MKKILIVLTNVSKYENYNIPTGLWLGELVHFYDEITKHGIEADFMSPMGGYIPIDPFSMKFIDEVDYKYYVMIHLWKEPLQIHSHLMR